jgi:hypothetical protein
MKQWMVFQCEVCLTEYGCSEAALWCEAQELPPCPVKAGDALEAYERYDKPESTTVKEIMVRGRFARIISGWSDTPEHWAEFIKLHAARTPSHEWCVKLSESHQFGKSCWTDEYPLGSLRVPGADTWLDGRSIND